MSADDYIRLGELTIQRDRARARCDRLIEVGDWLAARLQTAAVTQDDLDAIDAWQAAKAWDGAPKRTDRHPGLHRYRVDGPPR